MSRVSVLGSVNQDYVLTVARHPLPGETLLASGLHLLPGGKGANQAVAAARLGSDVTMIGCVGDDPAGDALLGQLRSAGVDTNFVTRIVGVPSGAAFVTVASNGENSIIVASGANAHCDVALVDRAGDVIRRSQVLVAQLEVPLNAIERALQIAAAGPGHTRVVLNASPPQVLSASWLAQVDVLVVNQHEARILGGLPGDGSAPDPTALAGGLVDLGARSVVVTCGAEGAVFGRSRAQGMTVTHVPAPWVRPVDTTGAGDAFAAALAVSLAEGRDLAHAVRFAVAVGTAVTTVVGAQGPISLAQVQSLLASIPEVVPPAGN